MMPRFLLPIALLFLPSILNANPVTLEKPADGAVIFGRQVDVAGVASGSNRVMLMIQKIESNDPWRVAVIVRPEADGHFVASFRLPTMKQDSAYRVIAVGAERTASLRSARPGTVMRRPPTGLPHSEVVRIAIAGTAKSALRGDRATERILLPVADASVGPTETVVIEGSGDPTAVVLIRNDEKGNPWYVQPSVERVGPGRTAVTVRFGSAETAAGSRFRVRLAIPQNAKQREAFQVGVPIADLPVSVPYSRAISVMLDTQKKPTVDLAQLKLQHTLAHHDPTVRLTAPVGGASTGRRTLVQGTCPADTVPILMVRSEDDLATWYIQPHCHRNAEGFENRIYLGKLGTRAGTRFQVIAMLVPPDMADRYASGNALTELPEQARISEPLLLIHTGTDQ